MVYIHLDYALFMTSMDQTINMIQNVTSWNVTQKVVPIIASIYLVSSFSFEDPEILVGVISLVMRVLGNWTAQPLAWKVELFDTSTIVLE